MFDFFGEHDPHLMPPHFFFGARRFDFSTAVKADIAKQDYSVCPRHWYVDATFRCQRCQADFLFSAEEQEFWYETLRFYVDSRPTHCPTCRHDLRVLKSMRQEYDANVAAAMLTDASLESKQRLVHVIDALENGGVSLSEKSLEVRRILLKQISRRQDGL